MTDTMLPQRSLTGIELRAVLGSHILLDGDPPGIIALDPLTVQCATCGATETPPDARSWQVFLLTSGYGFHGCTRGAEGRLCPECWAGVVAACGSARCAR